MSDTPAPAQTPPSASPQTLPPAPRSSVGGKLFLAVAAALFFGWLGWLSYTALTKSRGPIVSRAQEAAASVAVRANVIAGEVDKPALQVDVLEKVYGNGPDAGAKIGVRNLADCAGYSGPGEYLLLLTKDAVTPLDGHPGYAVVGQQRSPGAPLLDSGPPMIYKWNADVAKQVQRASR